jgi:hypothetical protein
MLEFFSWFDGLAAPARGSFSEDLVAGPMASAQKVAGDALAAASEPDRRSTPADELS